MPVLFISGQVNTWQMKTPEQRFNGVQELDIIKMVEPITKFACQMDVFDKIDIHLTELVKLAQQPRQGPVWLDIPLDVQSAEI